VAVNSENMTEGALSFSKRKKKGHGQRHAGEKNAKQLAPNHGERGKNLKAKERAHRLVK